MSINKRLRFFEILFQQANIDNLPKHMDECIHLIGGLLGHVHKCDPLKHVQMLNMSNE